MFDSGIGGLSVAAAVAELLPNENLLYVADNARAPYGPQSPEAILAYSREITRALIGAGCKLIVMACNTATGLAINELRDEFPAMPFVGLEPAVKPAARERLALILATAATLNSERYQKLKEEHFPGFQRLLQDPCTGLVPVIEAEPPGSPALRKKLREILDPVLEAWKPELIVLGCTHYSMVKDDISAVCGPGVRLYDPAPAVARQVRRLLKEQDMLNGEESGVYDFFTTGSSVPLQRTLGALPGLNAGRRLVVPQAR